MFLWSSASWFLIFNLSLPYSASASNIWIFWSYSLIFEFATLNSLEILSFFCLRSSTPVVFNLKNNYNICITLRGCLVYLVRIRACLSHQSEVKFWKSIFWMLLDDLSTNFSIFLFSYPFKSFILWVLGFLICRSVILYPPLVLLIQISILYFSYHLRPI